MQSGSMQSRSMQSDSMQMQVNVSDMAQGFQPVHHQRRQQKRRERKRRGGQQKRVHCTMQALPLPAVSAAAEMIFVIPTQILGDTRNIVTPAREDSPNHMVGAGVVTMRAWVRLMRLISRYRHFAFTSLAHFAAARKARAPDAPGASR